MYEGEGHGYCRGDIGSPAANKAKFSKIVVIPRWKIKKKKKLENGKSWKLRAVLIIFHLYQGVSVYPLFVLLIYLCTVDAKQQNLEIRVLRVRYYESPLIKGR